jgi:hypothetical protein
MDAANAIEGMPAQRSAGPRLEQIFLSLAAAPALADVCFWRDKPRLSAGVFALGAMGLILLNRPAMRWTRHTRMLVVLMGGAAVESAIDLCFSNVMVMLALLVAIAGETYYETLRNGWSRWSEAAWTMVKTPGRWLALMIATSSRPWESEAPRGLSWKGMGRIVWIAAPGLAVTGIFAVILGNGNALFAKLTSDWTTAIYNFFAQFDLSFWRFALWGCVATLTLPLLWPSPSPKKARFWTRELPRLPEIGSASTGRLQSATMLGLLNGLFFFVNTLDAVYLWAGRVLPAGVNPSAFVHEGVWSLIAAVVFSAILLAGVFHQSRGVSSWTPMRALALLWIGQNLVLLAGVFQRVKLYVDAFDLTVTRVNLVFFLMLVSIGFILLAIHVWRQRTLGWLLHANMLATFFLFYTVQFLDTPAFVARYNVNLWLKSGCTRALDMGYLKSLGPPAYDAMNTVAGSHRPEVGEALVYIESQREMARSQLAGTSWASWQLRDALCARKLLAGKQP